MKKYRCLNNGNCNTADTNRVFRLDPQQPCCCPECKSEMIMEVKRLVSIPVLAGTLAAVVAIAAALFLILPADSDNASAFSAQAASTEISAQLPEPSASQQMPRPSKKKQKEQPSEASKEAPQKKQAKPETIAPKKEATPAQPKKEATPAQPKKEAAPAQPKKEATPAQPTAKAPVTHLDNYNLGWGKYTGPAANGKPDGTGGTITVTGTHTIDPGDGSSPLTLNAGDRISSVKFKDGKLMRGVVTRPDGTAKKFSIGV